MSRSRRALEALKLKRQDAEALHGYLKKLELACHNFTIQCPMDGSAGMKALESNVMFWEVQAACHYASKIQSKSCAESGMLRTKIARLETAIQKKENAPSPNFEENEDEENEEA